MTAMGSIRDVRDTSVRHAGLNLSPSRLLRSSAYKMVPYKSKKIPHRKSNATTGTRNDDVSVSKLIFFVFPCIVFTNVCCSRPPCRRRASAAGVACLNDPGGGGGVCALRCRAMALLRARRNGASPLRYFSSVRARNEEHATVAKK